MKKIPTVYLRDTDEPKYVTDEVNPACDWVLAREGVPTRKFDGTCVMLDSLGKWWARREVKPGKEAPDGFVPITTDEMTGKTMGWEPVEQSSFAKVHAEAVASFDGEPGTFELIGPKVNGNPEGATEHLLVRHGVAELDPWSPIELMHFCRERGWEGVVWHHPDGRRAKLKVRDLR